GEQFDLSMLQGKNPGARLGIPIDAAETRAAVALLSRSIRIVSAGDAFGQPFPSGADQAGQYFGGHTIARQGFAAYQVQGVEFYQLGQGGRIAHYPVHFHMARETPPNTFIQDCSVHDSMTRWYTVHGTHGLLLARNVGYLSIGHGYYIEDGTEIQNRFFSNIGIFARSSVDNAQNPRQVPGILSAPDGIGSENVPYHTDLDHPAVFWIMNGYNDFQYNMAAGAGACRACFWLVPGSTSGPSRHQHWESYASIQATPGRAATGAAQVVPRQLLLVGDELVQRRRQHRAVPGHRSERRHRPAGRGESTDARLRRSGLLSHRQRRRRTLPDPLRSLRDRLQHGSDVRRGAPGEPSGHRSPQLPRVVPRDRGELPRHPAAPARVPADQQRALRRPDRRPPLHHGRRLHACGDDPRPLVARPPQRVHRPDPGRQRIRVER